MSDSQREGRTFLSDELYVQLARYLLAEGIAVGDPLPTEAELGAALGAGRQRVREALSVLEAFGVVVGRQGARRVWRGFRASDFILRGAGLIGDHETAIRELLEARHTLETSLLPLAIPRLTPAELQCLRGLSEEMVARAERGESFADQDEKFHRGLLAPLGNAIVDSLLQSFWAVFAAAPKDDEVIEDPEVAAMHGRIIDAIEAGDARRAVHELDAHFYGIRNRYPDIAFGAPVTLTA